MTKLTIKQVYEALRDEMHRRGVDAQVETRRSEREVEDERLEPIHGMEFLAPHLPRGKKVEVTEWHDLKVMGITCNTAVTLKDTWTKGSGRFGYGSKPNGKQSLAIGDYGQKTVLPSKADGTFSWDKAGEALLSYAHQKVARRRTQSAVETNRPVVEALREELGIHSYGGILGIGSSPDRPVVLSVKFEKAMTADEAHALVLALRKLGVLKA